MEKPKIIATIGPATSSVEILKEMAEKGMDVARLNFSHGKRKEHEELFRKIKEASKICGKDIPVLQDLEGFRLRVGERKETKEPWKLEKGEKVYLVKKNAEKNKSDIPFDYDGDLKVLIPGCAIHIDGGKIALRVIKPQKRRVLCQVEEGGKLLPRKGINIPDVDLGFSGLTGKDRKDLDFAFQRKVDFVAQSFVREAGDVLRVKEILKENSPKTQVIAKIENREAIKNIDEIIAVSDLVMIARGDMGIAIPLWEVPFEQKKIIVKCHKAFKPVITATEMLESMTRRKIPTRAEVSDVANAVLDGSDYVMLSEETAIGSHPVETVAMMQNIIDYTCERKSEKKASNLFKEGK